MKLSWPKRARRHYGSLGPALIWQASGGPYRVWKLMGYSAVHFHALVSEDGISKIVSKHRTLAAAKKACESHNRERVKESAA